MKKLIVCGDSFMSPVTSEEFKGTHFSELVAKKINFELISLAGGGMSNGGIAIQLKTAIEMKPDLIITNTTHSTRLEWTYNEVKTIQNISTKDLFYAQPESLARTYSWINKDPKVISYSFDQILYNDGRNRLPICISDDVYKEQRINALREYFLYLYHPDLKKFTDTLMMVGILHLLHESKIPYIFLKDTTGDIADSCKFLGKYNYASPDTNLVDLGYGAPNYKDPGYHTTPEHQRKVAEILLEKYIPHLLDITI